MAAVASDPMGWSGKPDDATATASWRYGRLVLSDEDALRVIRDATLPSEAEAIQMLRGRGTVTPLVTDATEGRAQYAKAWLRALLQRIPGLGTSEGEAKAWLRRARDQRWIEDAPAGGIRVTQSGKNLAKISGA